MKIKDIKYTYRDLKYDAICVNIMPSLEVKTSTYEDVFDALCNKIPNCSDLKIWSYTKKIG